MTAPTPAKSSTVKVVRRLLAPVFNRIDSIRDDLAAAHRRSDELGARLDQLSRQVERLEAYQHVSREQITTAFASLTTDLSGSSPDQSPGEILQRRLDHALLHAEALTSDLRSAFERELADVRSTVRLTQALAEQLSDRGPAPPREVPDPSDGGDADARATVDAAITPRRFEHPVPSFDLLYRSFEDHHRGSPEAIRDQQRDDYLDLLTPLPNPELPVADLGCGRGELVGLLVAEGIAAVGVDSNLGQVVDGAPELFVQADLFDWLDDQADGSLRAVLAMHVVEHLPLELQIRLVFESRRVLAPGGLLVLETPNALSISTAATNFWVDPTHHRPVHPLFLEFLATEAGFTDVATRHLHPLPVSFRGTDATKELVEDLDSLILGSGDLALVARR
jgi:SAM-dependent methyltransferase